MKNPTTARRIRLIKCLSVVFFCGLYVSLATFRIFHGNVLSAAHAQTSQTRKGAEPKPSGRFDALVREDFFAGMMGDEARLDRGMKFCEEILASNPKHAEALVWIGG